MSLHVYMWMKVTDSLEPCYCEHCETIPELAYTANITHNLTKMADEAGIYKYLWRPEELGIKKAGELVEPLEKGLALMKADRARFEKFNASNGWGLYENFVPWVERYLNACKEHPEAEIEVSR